MASAISSLQRVRLDSVVQFVGGGTPPKSRPDFFTGEIPWITPKDMKSFEIWDAIDHITPEAISSSTTSLIPANSLLAVVRSGVLKHHFPLAINRVPVAINQDIKALICSDDICPSFLLHFLRCSSPSILNRVRGTTADNIPVDELKAWPVPLPPLAQQRRIGAILDQADALGANREEALVKLQGLQRAVFVEMFGDPIRNPKRWDVRPLSELCKLYSGGTPSTSNEQFWSGSLPWFSAKDLKREDLFDSEDHISEAVPASTNLRLLPPNTVVVVVRGMILAHTFPVCVLQVSSTINQDLKAVLPKVPLEPQFLAAALRCQSSSILKRVSDAGHGTKRLDTDVLSGLACDLSPSQLPTGVRYANLGYTANETTNGNVPH